MLFDNELVDAVDAIRSINLAASTEKSMNNWEFPCTTDVEFDDTILRALNLSGATGRRARWFDKSQHDA